MVLVEKHGFFFLLHKMRGCCWKHKGGEGITTFLPQLNTREGQSMEQEGVFLIQFCFQEEHGGGVLSLNTQVNLLLFDYAIACH